jgi:hypothetical protein
MGLVFYFVMSNDLHVGNGLQPFRKCIAVGSVIDRSLHKSSRQFFVCHVEHDLLGETSFIFLNIDTIPFRCNSFLHLHRSFPHSHTTFPKCFVSLIDCYDTFPKCFISLIDCYNTFPKCSISLVDCNNTFLLCHNTFPECHTSFLNCLTVFPICTNPFPKGILSTPVRNSSITNLPGRIIKRTQTLPKLKRSYLICRKIYNGRKGFFT